MLTSEAQQQKALARVTELALADLRAMLRGVDVQDAAAVAEVIVDGVPVIAERYGLAAGTLAADWYEELRDRQGAPGSFQAVIPDLPDRGRWEAMAGWIASGDKTQVEELVSGGLQRVIADMHRRAVMDSSLLDPAAAGWARFARGVETCDFCYMLVSRGAVYTDATAKFGAHDNCSCAAGPIWKGTEGARQVDAYRRSTRRRSEETTKRDNERAREWMRDQGLL